MIDGVTVAIFLTSTTAIFCLLFAVRLMFRHPPKTPAKLKIRSDWSIALSAKSETYSAQFDHWFTLLLTQSGIRLDRHLVIFMLAGASLLSGIAALVFEYPAFVQLISGSTVFVLGFAILLMMKRHRIQNFSRQFPTSLDLLARSVRAGQEFEKSMESVCLDSEEPLAAEFRWCQQQMSMGLAPADAVAALARRIPTIDVQLFAHTISLHRNLGGRLSDSLERLSAVIRERTAQLEKIKSITGIGRFAVFAILAMAIFATVYLSWIHPEYLAKLYHSELGRKMLIYAAISEFIGVVWAVWTLHSEL